MKGGFKPCGTAVYGNRKIRKNCGTIILIACEPALRIPMFILSDGSSVGVAEKSSILRFIVRNTATKDVAISDSGNTSVKSGWKRERIWSVIPAERLSRPNDPMPSIAVMPADKRRTDKMLRMILSPQNEDLALCATKR